MVSAGSVVRANRPAIGKAKARLTAGKLTSPTLVFLARDYPSARPDMKIAAAVASELKAIGVTATVKPVAKPAGYYAALAAGQADLFVSPFWPDTDDPDDFLTGLVTSQAKELGLTDAPWYPKYLARMSAAAGATPAARSGQYADIAGTLVGHYIVGVPVAFTASSWLIGGRVQGFASSPLRLERFTSATSD